MKIFACYIIYNEADKIAISLHSIVPYVDKVIIVDGAWKSFNNPSPKSTDNSKAICESICGDKLIWIERDTLWEDEVEKRNQYMSVVPDGDWMFILDADTLVSGNIKENLDKIKLNDGYMGHQIVTVRMINFCPILSDGDSRKIPPRFISLLWDIEDIEKSKIQDWCNNPLPDNTYVISNINWIGYYGPVACLLKKQPNMRYLEKHSNFVWDGVTYPLKWNTIPDILSVNMKFLNTWKRHVDMAKHKINP